MFDWNANVTLFWFSRQLQVLHTEGLRTVLALWATPKMTHAFSW